MYQEKTTNAKDKAKLHADNAVSDFKSGKSELKQAGRDLRDAGEDLYDDVRDEASRASRTLRGMAHDAGERVQHFFDGKKDQLHDARDTAERTIRSNPLASTAAAFGVGLLLARLIRR